MTCVKPFAFTKKQNLDIKSDFRMGDGDRLIGENQNVRGSEP